MDKINICFYCLDSSKKLYLCDTCILEQRMSNYNFQLCYECLKSRSEFHDKINTMSKLEMDIYITNKGCHTDLF